MKATRKKQEENKQEEKKSFLEEQHAHSCIHALFPHLVSRRLSKKEGTNTDTTGIGVVQSITRALDKLPS